MSGIFLTGTKYFWMRFFDQYRIDDGISILSVVKHLGVGTPPVVLGEGIACAALKLNTVSQSKRANFNHSLINLNDATVHTPLIHAPILSIDYI